MFAVVSRWSAILGALLFIFMVVAIGVMTPDYNPIGQFVSELGAVDAPFSAVMNFVGIVPFGSAIILFALGFFTRAHFGHLTVLGGALLALSGAGLVAAGFSPCDVGCPFEGSRTQLIHNWTAFSAFILAFFSAIWIGVSALWGAKRVFPLLAGIVAAAAMGISFNLMGAGGLDHPMIGLYQRAFLLALCLWLIAIGAYSVSTAAKRGT